jgi:hypothetical protein
MSASTTTNTTTTAERQQQTGAVAAATDWLGDADDWGDDEPPLDNSRSHLDMDNGNTAACSSPGSSSPDTITPPSPMGAAGGFPPVGRPENRNFNSLQRGIDTTRNFKF